MSLWGDLSSIPALPLIQVLALPASLPTNTQILADGIAPTSLGGYTQFVTQLQAAAPDGWQVVAYPYDWRLSARTLGQQLATFLAFTAAQGDTNIVVAHSYGALVSWLTWAALVDSGNTAALSRILTFGGALYGASATPAIFLENEAALANLVALQQLASGSLGGALTAGVIGPTDAQVQALLTCAATWPAVYDLYPDHGAQDDPGDTLRVNAFTQSLWTAALAQPNWTTMSAEVTAVHTYVRQPKYVPPLTQVLNIVSNTQPTPYRVQPAASSQGGPGHSVPPPWTAVSPRLLRLWQLPSWSSTILGDARVTYTQASWPGARLIQVSSLHSAMQNDPAVLVAVLAYLQGPITPPSPIGPSGQPVADVPAPVPPDKLALAAQLLASSSPPVRVPAINLIEGIVVDSPSFTPPPPPIPVRVGVDP